jgi:hypothetical protein
VSVEALSWALNNETVTSPTSKLVLIALANHADRHGRNAFPSVATISLYTCLSERAIRQHLDLLEKSGLIRPSDPEIVAAYIKRADRRPLGFDLAMDGVQEVPVVRSRGASHAATGCISRRNGVQEIPERGAGDAPEPLLEPYTEPSIETVSDVMPSTLAQSEYLDDAKRLCQVLADCIVANGSKPPKVTTTWVAEMDRLMRIDGRTPSQVESAIRWSQGNDFWKANILSPMKLRAKYETLRLQASREMKQREPRSFAGIREFLSAEGDLL